MWKVKTNSFLKVSICEKLKTNSFVKVSLQYFNFFYFPNYTFLSTHYVRLFPTLLSTTTMLVVFQCEKKKILQGKKHKWSENNNLSR